MQVKSRTASRRSRRTFPSRVGQGRRHGTRDRQHTRMGRKKEKGFRGITRTTITSFLSFLSPPFVQGRYLFFFLPDAEVCSEQVTASRVFSLVILEPFTTWHNGEKDCRGFIIVDFSYPYPPAPKAGYQSITRGLQARDNVSVMPEGGLSLKPGGGNLKRVKRRGSE